MDFNLNGVSLREKIFQGRDAIEVTMPSSAFQDPEKETLLDRDYMAWLPTDFRDGTIEVDVASVLELDAPAYARGFIGLAFRIDDKSFESVYLRPTNSQADDQVRRNRSVQYAAYPDFTFPRLRREEPGKYETYADISTDEWISMRLEVSGARAELFINDAARPVLIVSDLKLGAARSGGIGLWIESGTIGYFSGLKIQRRSHS